MHTHKHTLSHTHFFFSFFSSVRGHIFVRLLTVLFTSQISQLLTSTFLSPGSGKTYFGDILLSYPEGESVRICSIRWRSDPGDAGTASRRVARSS